MTSYEFEVAAKNAVVKSIKVLYDEDYNVNDISIVWFSHVLGNKKAIVIDNGKNSRIYEVTYNTSKGEMYCDTYEKKANTVYNDKDIGLMTKQSINPRLVSMKLNAMSENKALSTEYMKTINEAITLIDTMR